MKCPLCNNVDPSTIEHNGCKPSDPVLTYLCVARVVPGTSSLEGEYEGPRDRNGLVGCFMQWEPNR